MEGIPADARHVRNRQDLALFSQGGERKYLSTAERTRFHAALDVLDEESRTFCEMIFWTGCRPSEALALTVRSISLDGRYVVIRSLKKRGNAKDGHFRIVPLPGHFIERLERVHGLCCLQAEDRGSTHLWSFGRTTGWQRMAAVMKTAGIAGVRASARGLRHSFGVNAALCGVPETRIQKWMGHASLATTAIYLDMAALEDREMARRMWSAPLAVQVCPEVPPIDSELLRLVSAYSAIPETAPRLAFLSSIEATARYDHSMGAR